jgi:hypothetical protein
MSDRSTRTKVASSVLPSVKPPSPRFSVPEVIHRNPLETVSRVHAEFDGFTKNYYVVVRHPFISEPAEALAIAWVPIEDCVTLVLEQKIIDCLTVSAVLAYRCLIAGR